jgi:glycosyltransferase involved in cell wall biosynthesis
MRILQICNKAPYPANDGSSIAIYNLASGLIENDVDLTLLTINTKKHFKPDDDVPVDFKQKINYKSIYKNTNPTALGAFINLFSSHSYFVSRFYFKEFETVLSDILSKQKFDIIQLEGVFMGVYIPCIKNYSNAKIILRAHNIEHQIWSRHLKSEKNPLKKIYLQIQNNRLKKFELKIINTVNAVVTITEIDEANIKLINPKKQTFTSVTGINLTEYKFADKPQYPNTLFHFASMDWLPNEEAVTWFIEKVWPNVISKNLNTRLVLAGRGMPQKFKKMASDTITIIEKVNSSSAFYHQYDIMLVPLLSGSGLRIKLVEGLAYGKAIITTSIGAEGIPYENKKQMIIADTANEFSEAVIHLLQNPQLKDILQVNARKLAEEKFDYKKVAKELIEFYKNIKA